MTYARTLMSMSYLKKKEFINIFSILINLINNIILSKNDSQSL